MSDRPFRIGVAGLGFGAAVHVPALRRVPGLEIVALAGSDRDRARDAAERLGIPTGCGGIAELLDRELDAVTLALPPSTNEEALDQVLSRNIAVLSEKPLGRDAKTVEDLARRAEGRTATVDFEFAELPCFAELKRTIDSRRLGAVREVVVSWNAPSWAQRNRIWSWKSDAGAGGGVMALLGAHVLYLFDWLFGGIAKVLELHADAGATRGFAPPDACAAADTVSFEAVLRDGAMARVGLSNAAGHRPLHRWRVDFAEGWASIENRGGDYASGFRLAIADRDDHTIGGHEDPAGSGDGRIAAVASLAARFVAAAKTRTPSHPDFAAGARVQRWMAEIAAAGEA